MAAARMRATPPMSMFFKQFVAVVGGGEGGGEGVEVDCDEVDGADAEIG